MEQYHYGRHLGWMELKGVDGVLTSICLLSHTPSANRKQAPSLTPYVEQLDVYFAGHPMDTEKLELSVGDTSDFSQQLFTQLQTVPFGQLLSYGELAAKTGNPQSAQAVGQTLGTNSFPLFIPCHRVIRSDGYLGGFMAGQQWKANLLRHEGHRITSDNYLLNAR